MLTKKKAREIVDHVIRETTRLELSWEEVSRATGCSTRTLWNARRWFETNGVEGHMPTTATGRACAEWLRTVGTVVTLA